MSRSKDERLHHKKRIQQKKKKILKQVMLYEETRFTPQVMGELNKGKIHCSCWMCSNKTNRDGLKFSEQKKMDAMKKEMDEYK